MGATPKEIQEFIDFFYEGKSTWEKPTGQETNAFIQKGQMMFFNYKKVDHHGALFAIATEDFPNQGFAHYTFGHCRDGK